MNLILKDYKVLGKKGEGTFSEVLKCQRNQDQQMYACKKMKHTYSNMDQVNALREIQAMKRLNPHPFIVHLDKIIYDQRSGSLVLVLELMEMNLYEFIRGRRQYLPEAKVCCLMWQMMQGLDHMHKLGIFHRDIKPENLLVREDRLKLADFGSCRAMKSQPPFTEYISTRWYRAPECLLTDGWYGAAMDVWSAGCVLFEIATLRPLFPGANEVDQIAKIHDILGTPPPEIMQKFKGKSRHVSYNFTTRRGTGVDSLMLHATPQCVEAVKRMVEYDPASRPSARSVLRLPYFHEFKPPRELKEALLQVQRQKKESEENKENQRSNNSQASERAAASSVSSLPPLATAISTTTHKSHTPQQQGERITPVIGSVSTLSPAAQPKHKHQQPSQQQQQNQQQQQHHHQLQQQQQHQHQSQQLKQIQQQSEYQQLQQKQQMQQQSEYQQLQQKQQMHQHHDHKLPHYLQHQAAQQNQKQLLQQHQALTQSKQQQLQQQRQQQRQQRRRLRPRGQLYGQFGAAGQFSLPSLDLPRYGNVKPTPLSIRVQQQQQQQQQQFGSHLVIGATLAQRSDVQRRQKMYEAQLRQNRKF